MSAILQALAAHARTRPGAPALEGEATTLDYRQLEAEVTALAEWLRERGARCLALLLDNGPAWMVWDLAAQRAGVPLLPVPLFFTPDQQRHALDDAAADHLVCDRVDAPVAGRAGGIREVAGTTCFWSELPRTGPSPLPPGTAKVTYTSGTTGRPKGVCLSQDAVDAVAVSLREAVAAGPDDRHLAILPLATLLENVASQVPLLAGGSCLLWPQGRIGMQGSSRVDPLRMARALADGCATTAVTVPALLRALVEAIDAGVPRPVALRFLAVGGGAVAPRLLERAAGLGLPVYQGYGLSECASVVAVNRPGADAPGSVGRPLSHVRLALAEDGEVRVHSPGFLGYLGQPARWSEWWDTGDLGRLDPAGNLVLHGRKKNLFITAYGRNVDPEWVEAELTAEPAIRQAAVFGEARPWNCAVLVSSVPEAVLSAAVAAANRRLPDYARVRAWIRSEHPFTAADGLATVNGRVRRDAVAEAWGAALEALYEPREVS